MDIEFWAATDVGKQRSQNEDNYLIDKNLRLFVVADGMGGHAAGEVASSLCVRRVRDAVAENRDILESYANGRSTSRNDILRLLEHSVQAACSTIYQRAQEQPDKRGMGTTCTLLLIVGDRGFLAHVGDSRIYLIRKGQIHQLSEDHSLINELTRRGKLEPHMIDSSPYKDFKNAVTRAVGVYESVEVDTLDFDVLPGDQFFLSTDGLHSYLDDNEKILNSVSAGDAKAITQRFIALANDGGGHDNITVVFVRVAGQPVDDKRARDVSLKFDVLQQMPFFRYLTYKELVRVLNSTHVREFSADELVLKEGTAGNELYIILDGEVRLNKGDTYITSLQRGDHVGEMALVESAPRSASGFASTGTRLLVLHRDEFFKMVRNEPQLSVKILWSLAQVMAQRLRKTTADLSGARIESTLPDMTDDIFEESGIFESDIELTSDG